MYTSSTLLFALLVLQPTLAFHVVANTGSISNSLARSAPRSIRMSAARSFTPNAPRDGGQISEPEALWALGSMMQVDVQMQNPNLKVPTTFIRPAPSQDGPVVLFLHGADFSCMEWRFVMRQLCERGVDCVALDWYSGGWTERAGITQSIQEGVEKPWTLVRQHLQAFWQQELQGRPVTLVGASLGGAVAIDFASTIPEAVEQLILIDSGGESYKAPAPDIVSALAVPVQSIKSFFQGLQAKQPTDESRIVSLHRGQLGCYEASLEYLKSGSMARRVDRERVKTVPQPTAVIWGTEDNILPLSDAYAFQSDLPRCMGVYEVAGSGHSPHLDQPDRVLELLAKFV